MNKVSKLPKKSRKTETLQQKIDAAQKQKAKLRAETVLEPVTISPVDDMTPGYTAAGMILRTLVLFIGVLGLSLFLFDALKIVILSSAKAENITVTTGFIVLWSLAVTLVVMALSLHKISRILSPFVVIGGIAAYLATLPDPVGYPVEAFRRLYNLIIENLADAGYTTYMQYITAEPFSYDETALVKFAVAAVIVITGLLLGLFMAKRVYAPGAAAICAVYMIPVFMFNIIRTNKGLATLLVFIVGLVGLYLYDCIYGGVFAARKAKADAKKAAKLAKKNAKKAAKQAKLDLKNNAAMAYNTAIEAGMSRSAAKKARAAVYAKDKKEREEHEKAEKLRLAAEKKAKKAAKLAAKEEKKAAKLAKKEERRKLRARAATAKKSKNADELASLSKSRVDAKAAAKEARREKNAGEVKSFKIRAAAGFAGGMAMLIAFLSIWLPLVAIKKNFPIIDVINNRMQLVRTYVTAYLMGDDVDLNSLAMYGGVAELNPRTVDFNTPQYTGQLLFKAETGYAAPVYMRSWIGSDYDLETDYWSSADSDEVLAYRARFGNSYTPDNIHYFYNKYLYPEALRLEKVDQYRNFDDYGFRVFQVHLERRSGTSKILFLPAIINAEKGLMDYGSLEPTARKYSAYYDGIYSSRFFEEGTSYSVFASNPVMKVPEVGYNYEGSIEYYMLAKKYADAIDVITSEISGNILFKEENTYTYETGLGTLEITGSDLTVLVEMFAAEADALGYPYKQNFVEMYLAMTSGERRTFHSAYNTELNYRDYAESTYRTTFGSDAIADLAQDILADAGIVMNEKPVHDKTEIEKMSEYQIKRLTNEELYGNYYESWFTDAATGEVIPRHEAIMAVINYLRDEENYTYTLDPVCPQTELLDEEGNVVLDEEGNPVMVDVIEADSNLEAFLFDIKQGYCVHFATSAVALLRELGFAVRYDEGYIAAGWNRNYSQDATSTYITAVRDYDAHSWIEVYYPAMGWVTYECTPSYAEEMYDIASSSTSTSSGINQNKVTVKDNLPEVDETIDVLFGEEEEVDYTAALIAIAVVAGILIVLSGIWAVLKVRAGKAMTKRRELVEAAKNEAKWMNGETDVHASARAIIDCIFDVFDGLGCPHETGELPTEYAARLDEDYTDISKHRITDVMNIIEKEEFGGRLTFRELCTLAEYLHEIQSSVYAALPAGQKLRMRYFMNVI